MSVGAGISASLGIATETTPGVPAAVTRFVEFDNETIKVKTEIVQGMGLRQGSQDPRASRRNLVARAAAGDLNFAPTTTGFGLWLMHMLGSYAATPTQIGTTAFYQQVHNPGPLAGKAFTTQVVRPDTTGVLAQQAHTYTGCKVTDWTITVAEKKEVALKVAIDALDQMTPSSTFAATALAAAVTAGATTITTAAAIPAGAYFVVDTGVNAEVLQSSSVTSTTTPTLASPATLPHATGVYVANATNVNAGAAVALQTASYSATTRMLDFAHGSVTMGGATTTTSGVFTNIGGNVVGAVRTLTITGKNPLNVARPNLGSMLRLEQLDNGWRDYQIELEVEFFSRALFDAYVADTQTALQVSLTSPTGASLTFYAPAAYQEDGGQPNVAGPDLLTQKLKYVCRHDGANGVLQVLYISTDTAL